MSCGPLKSNASELSVVQIRFHNVDTIRRASRFLWVSRVRYWLRRGRESRDGEGTGDARARRDGRTKTPAPEGARPRCAGAIRETRAGPWSNKYASGGGGGLSTADRPRDTRSAPALPAECRYLSAAGPGVTGWMLKLSGRPIGGGRHRWPGPLSPPEEAAEGAALPETSTRRRRTRPAKP